mmetsp:Transcript_52250/g.130158  ORF Transcript_52250/g.130158 Transcript_52250/m.130158 type:complete len:111 (+) Transcript_52250:96-428(+)|eukprot:CAMPEP_0173439834 /NCGR_PEP_ID=MMETSP1357-20121228/21671_1 /TAXON_ID=77926 /ORGANISM="Hemiselmis rufescens, Strain PCC563" /LENGTH=110 /DNA_ID=CAMNT_0014405237 /DNA_START=93 /DNA_END=425 /DNA_ORIENTATION=+
MASAFNKSSMLSLYRSVLRIHRRVLPQEMKELGDKYARSEFKAHKSAKIGQVKQFVQQWKEYVYTLDIQAQKGAFGRDLDGSKLDKMSDEQKDQLKQLEEESRRIGSGNV